MPDTYEKADRSPSLVLADLPQETPLYLDPFPGVADDPQEFVSSSERFPVAAFWHSLHALCSGGFQQYSERLNPQNPSVLEHKEQTQDGSILLAIAV